MVFGLREVIRFRWGHGGRASIISLMPFQEDEGPELPLSLMCGYNEKSAVYSPEGSPHQNPTLLIMEPPAYQLWEINCDLSHPAYGLLLQQPELRCHPREAHSESLLLKKAYRNEQRSWLEQKTFSVELEGLDSQVSSAATRTVNPSLGRLTQPLRSNNTDLAGLRQGLNGLTCAGAYQEAGTQ